MNTGDILTRFWFEFDREAWNPSLGRFGYLPHPGCGVTAYDYRDALRLLRRWVLRTDEMPKLSRVIVDVDVSALIQTYRLYNVGCPVWRGVWYPQLNLLYGPDRE